MSVIGELVDSAALNTILELQNDSEFNLRLNKMFEKKCYPYVPYVSGQLAKNITIDNTGITYNQPYASSVYESSGQHNLEKHPLATSRWDEVALANHSDEISNEVANIAEKRLRELR